MASAVEYENLCRQTEENGIGSQFTTPLENGQTEVISLDSQGIMIKKSFDEEGNQTREFQYNPAENTRKVKTFAAERETSYDQNQQSEEHSAEKVDKLIDQIFASDSGRPKDNSEKSEEEKTSYEDKKQKQQDKKEESSREKQKEIDKKKEKRQEDKDRKKQLDKEKAELENERDNITQQYSDLRARLAAARETLDIPDLLPEQKQIYQKEYDELYAQTVKTAEKLHKLRKENKDSINNYNSRVEKHNSGLEEHFKK